MQEGRCRLCKSNLCRDDDAWVWAAGNHTETRLNFVLARPYADGERSFVSSPGAVRPRRRAHYDDAAVAAFWLRRSAASGGDVRRGQCGLGTARLPWRATRRAAVG